MELNFGREHAGTGPFAAPQAARNHRARLVR